MDVPRTRCLPRLVLSVGRTAARSNRGTNLPACLSSFFLQSFFSQTGHALIIYLLRTCTGHVRGGSITGGLGKRLEDGGRAHLSNLLLGHADDGGRVEAVDLDAGSLAARGGGSGLGGLALFPFACVGICARLFHVLAELVHLVCIAVDRDDVRGRAERLVALQSRVLYTTR